MKTSLPPSSAGIGKRFNNPMLTLKNPNKLNTYVKPASRACPAIEKIPIGPDKFLTDTVPLNKSFKVSITDVNEDQVLFPEYAILFKIENFESGLRLTVA